MTDEEQQAAAQAKAFLMNLTSRIVNTIHPGRGYLLLVADPIPQDDGKEDFNVGGEVRWVHNFNDLEALDSLITAFHGMLSQKRSMAATLQPNGEKVN